MYVIAAQTSTGLLKAAPHHLCLSDRVDLTAAHRAIICLTSGLRLSLAAFLAGVGSAMAYCGHDCLRKL